MLKWHILQILYLLLGSFCQTVENEGNLFVFNLADFSCKSIILTQARTSIVLDWRFLHGCHYFCTLPTVVVIEFKYDENTREILCFLHINYGMRNL